MGIKYQLGSKLTGMGQNYTVLSPGVTDVRGKKSVFAQALIDIVPPKPQGPQEHNSGLNMGQTLK